MTACLTIINFNNVMIDSMWAFNINSQLSITDQQRVFMFLFYKEMQNIRK